MAVNISRTAREADSRSVAPSGAAPTTGFGSSLTGVSPTRCLPDFRQGYCYRSLGYVLYDFYFADFSGKHKVDSSSFGFFVGLHQLQGLCGLHVDFGKWSPGTDGAGDAVIEDAVAQTNLRRNLCGGDHSPGHGFSVEKMTIGGGGFESVADGVSEIQDAAKIAFFFIRGNHLRFQTNGFGQYPCEEVAVFA